MRASGEVVEKSRLVVCAAGIVSTTFCGANIAKCLLSDLIVVCGLRFALFNV